MVKHVLKIASIFISLSFLQASLAYGLTLSNSATSKVGAAADYATEVWNDPWDMSNVEDLWPVYTNITGTTFSNGQFSGTASTADPAIYLLWGGYPGSLAAPRDGMNKPIDPNTYEEMSLRMYSSNAGKAQIYWTSDPDLSKGTEFRQFNVKAGWHIYHLAKHSSWTGRPLSLRLDPINIAGATFALDWFRLIKSNGNSVTLSTDSALSSAYDVYVDSDSTGYDGDKMNYSVASGATSATTGLQSLAPGSYNFYLQNQNNASDQSSYASVAINSPPTINITEPNLAGGKDWAATHTGDPWDMSNSSDITATYNVAGRVFRNGYFTGYNEALGGAKDDPFVFLNQHKKRINAAKYHRLSVVYKYDDVFNLVRGTMARFGWKNYPTNKGWQQTNDILTYDGWTTLTYDLASASLDIGSYGWRNYITSLRFDPHEDPQTRRFYIDDIKIAADDAMENRSFVIKYNLNDSDEANVALNLKADPDTTPNNGNETLIVTLSPASGQGEYNWVGGNNLNGSYNILAEVSDGLNSSYSYSTGPVLVDNYTPVTYAKKSVAKRVSEKKAARYLKLYKAYKAKIKVAKNPANKKRFIKLARKYNKAYLVAKKGIARAIFRWYVKDPYSQNEAKVKLVIQKRSVKKVGGKKARAASKRIVAYKTLKVVNYGLTDINQWRSYVMKTRSAGTYKYMVYATDPSGNSQAAIGQNWIIIK